MIISDLQKGITSCRVKILRLNPFRNLSKRRQCGRIGFPKECLSTAFRPFGQLIVTSEQFIPNLADTEDLSIAVLPDTPLPQCRTKIKTVVQILGLNKDSGVEEAGHYCIILSLWGSVWKVETLERPRIVMASRYTVCPSIVLSTTARANRLLTRAD